MSDQGSETPQATLLRQRALSRWDNEGGAGSDGSQMELAETGDQDRVMRTDAAELAALHIRVIALESLVVALLAGGSDRQIEQARSVAQSIVSRQGAEPDELARHAAIHSAGLIDRGIDLRDAGTC